MSRNETLARQLADVIAQRLKGDPVHFRQFCELYLTPAQATAAEGCVDRFRFQLSRGSTEVTAQAISAAAAEAIQAR